MTTSTLFIAGATGAIGSRLTPMLVARGHRVVGLTRSPDKMAALWAQGAIPLVGNVYDTAHLTEMMRATRPDAVIHMLTDLPPNMEPSLMAEAIPRNARIRREGTASLIAAARAADVKFMVAESIAWVYAPGARPYTEESPLDLNAEGARGISIGGAAALEQAVLNTPGLNGAVLRFGQLYGPGTHSKDATGKTLPLHVDGAALATVRAVEAKRSGIFNIVEPNDEVAVDKAQRELGWGKSSSQPPGD
jgi:nucleoside-diphosphate-sugar epimerase